MGHGIKLESEVMFRFEITRLSGRSVHGLANAPREGAPLTFRCGIALTSAVFLLVVEGAKLDCA